MSSNLPVSYTIDHEGLSLEIAVIESDKLLLHEETIPEKLNKLENNLLRDQVQKAPIIVDKNTLVVLDGMHRTKIMRKLGIRFIVACFIDYEDPKIIINRWCRIIPKPFNKVKAGDILKRLQFNMQHYEMVEDPNFNNDLILVFKNSVLMMATSEDDIRNLLKNAYLLETELLNWGYDVKQCTESQAMDLIKRGKIEAALFPPRVEKKNVIDIAMKGEVFTPKATRHTLPARPVGVDVPLSMLSDTTISLEEANRKLFEHLNSKKLQMLGAGKTWNRRKYEETLYIFS
jgi:hypothetical protein